MCKKKNKKGDDCMPITKPIKPMDHEFETFQDELEFEKWVTGKKPTPEQKINSLKHNLNLYRKMKRRIDDER